MQTGEGGTGQGDTQEAWGEGAGKLMSPLEAPSWLLVWQNPPPCPERCSALGEPRAQLTQRHDGEVFPPELAGDGDLLPEAPAVLGEHVVCG